MSDCSEIGHNYEIGILGGEVVYGCTRGCGDIRPLKSMAKEEIIEIVKTQIEKRNSER